MEFNEQEESRIQNLKDLQEEGVNAYPTKAEDIRTKVVIIQGIFDSLVDSEKEVSISGRMVLKRVMGGSSFAQIEDDSGTIQIFLNKKRMGEEAYNQFRYQTDLGDIISVSGNAFYTRTEEPTIKVGGWQLLSKSLTPLPDKHEGLKDTETRLRNRHMDLIANPKVRKVFRVRSKILSSIRSFLQDHQFLEVETPTLHPIYGGANARPFTTHHNQLHQDLYLRIAPELYLKRLLVGGFEKVYELGKVFRNEGVDRSHNPEFTSLEIYRAYADYEDMKALTEALVQHVLTELPDIHNQGLVEYGDLTIDFDQWTYMTLVDSIKEYTPKSLDVLEYRSDEGDSLESLREAIEDNGLEVKECNTWAKTVEAIFDVAVEPNLINPVFITDYPVELSPLAKRKEDDPTLTERFEFFVGGMEIANAFSELNDPLEQEQRFLDQGRAFEAGDDEAMQMDTDYLKALMAGMPPAGGLGFGIDRLVMLMTNSSTIREVILFPHLRSQDQNNG